MEFQLELEKNALQFEFQDGTINKIYSSQNEPVWVLNIKRGILSALQNSMNEDSSYTHLYEVLLIFLHMRIHIHTHTSLLRIK